MPAGSITAGPKSVTRAMDAASLRRGTIASAMQSATTSTVVLIYVLRLLSGAIPSTWIYLISQNSSDNLLSYPPDSHNSSANRLVYCMEGSTYRNGMTRIIPPSVDVAGRSYRGLSANDACRTDYDRKSWRVLRVPSPVKSE